MGLNVASNAYKQGTLMIDENESVMSEHGVTAIQDLWRGMMASPDSA